MKFLRNIHPSCMVLTFAIGCVVGSIISVVLKPAIFSSCLWLFLALALLFFSIARPKTIILPFALFSGILLIMSRASPVFVSENYLKNYIDQEIIISGTVSKDPDASDSGANLVLDNLEISGQKLASSTKIFAQVSSKKLKRTDRITVSGKFSEGFGSYRGTVRRASVLEIGHLEPEDFFLKFRDFFAGKIKEHLPSPESGIALGYLLGQKNGVDEAFVEALSIVGLTHIIVASGAHLSILTGFMRKTFGRLSRFACLFSSVIITIIFICITGLSASMLRAGLVACLSLVLWYFGREISPSRLIILVAAATLIFNPFYVIDLAWLLSFSSFTGILVLSPAISKFLYGKDKKPGFVSSILITSISAALLCSPILLFYFGQISLFSIFANLLVLPTISIVMGFAMLTGVFALIIPSLAPFFAQITRLIIDYQIFVVNFFKDLKFSLITIEKNNFLVFLIYIPIIVVIFTTLFFKRKHRQKATISVQN